MPDHLERLERHHRLVILSEVADDPEDVFMMNDQSGGWGNPGRY